MKPCLPFALLATLAVTRGIHATTLPTNTTMTDPSTRHLADATYLFEMCGLDLSKDSSNGNNRDVNNFKAANPDSCAFYIPQLYYGVTWTDYEGGTCWVKRDVVRTQVSVNPGAVSYFRSDVTQTYLEVQRLPNTDVSGYDVGSTKAYGWQYDKCLVDCTAHPKCFAVTWTDFEGGTCWLKNRANTPVARQGAVSSFLAKSQTTVGSCPRL